MKGIDTTEMRKLKMWKIEKNLKNVKPSWKNANLQIYAICKFDSIKRKILVY